MILNAKTEYACLAMLQLALEYQSGEPVRVGRIAGEHGIPKRFLVQILLQLKHSGLVESLRGASGGYRLGHHPENISMADILQAVESRQKKRPSALAKSQLTQVLDAFYHELNTVRQQQLSAITLADLADQAAIEVEPTWDI
jgi:Rrf2 family protein